MDNSGPALADSCPTSSPLSNGGGSMRGGVGGGRSSLPPLTSAGGRPASLLDQQQAQPHVVRVVVNRDDRGYGMKVSGDNPVYVQSVKEGGAAERAGLHAGDKIIKVNGVNVMQSTHTQVVALIRSSSQVVLTVQQRLPSPRGAMGSPSLHQRPATTPTSSRITGPQPVDNEKQHQLQMEKEQYYRLMIEKEQHYLDVLRSQIAASSSPDEKKCAELAKTERNLHTLQAMLERSQNEQQPTSPVPLFSSPTPFSSSRGRSLPAALTSPNDNTAPEVPPPLPKRNCPPRPRSHSKQPHSADIYALFLTNEINANHLEAAERPPPPLPPRACPQSSSEAAANSINKQMSYPLVATCATLVDNFSPNPPTHHRTKSSPESLTGLSGADDKRKLSESLNDLSRQEGWEGAETPPGTPPPPYPSPQPGRRNLNDSTDDGGGALFEEHLVDGSSPEGSPFRVMSTNSSSPIHAATPQTVQRPIISMEDDEISDQENSQLEDQGHFKSLSRLWEHLPHLAVFTNYVLSNSDPNSLLFYLLTDLYKEGNAKEMRKWAFEIHSCFLVPGGPLRLSNVDENIAREIDDVLTREWDKEEQLRKVFWKARARAKEELTRQLADFQGKRTAGLGTMFGPPDAELREVYVDKQREARLYETLLLPKLEPHLEELERGGESADPRHHLTAAALTTVLQRVFGVRLPLDRCPASFVSKDKSFRTKFMGKYTRKLNILGHQFVAQQYYTVITCKHCHQIIYGIGPQGYQCSVCLINLHRPCVKLYDDPCPGPLPSSKKDARGIRFSVFGMRHDTNEHNKIKKTSNFLQTEKERRQMEERDSSFDTNESGEIKGGSGGGHAVARSGSDRRPDAVREECLRHQNSVGALHGDSPQHDAVGPAAAQDKNDALLPDSSVSLPVSENRRKVNSNINRSESVKEQSEKRKQRRNISDPSHNNTSCDVELERHQSGLSKNTDSGSSSNSSLSNGRLSESPCNSTDVQPRTKPLDSDSEMDSEVEPPNWQELVPEEELRSLNSHEKKRQDILNELFYTEYTHVRNLNVLYKIFYKKLKKSGTLKPDEISLIFPNIREMLAIHSDFNNEMTRMRRERPIVGDVGDMLLGMFGGEQGDALRRAAATFCERQQLALEFIRRRRERDSKFDGVLAACEKNRRCRRLPLQGIVTAEMQRLSKYPLLLERLAGGAEAAPADEEAVKLRAAHHMSKEILNHVNEAAKVALNRHRLEEIQRHLDTSAFERSDHAIASEFRPLDLTRYQLLLEGGMQLRRPGKAVVPVHILLLEEMVVILHREAGDRFVLKFFQSGAPAQPQPLSPIIKMSTLLVRYNAPSKNALFLVNTSTNNSQMYDLIAEDESKREVWYKHFSDAADAYNKREGKTRRQGGGSAAAPADDSDSEVVQELPTASEVLSVRAEAVGADEEAPEGDGDGDRPQEEDQDDDAQTKDESTANDEGAAAPDMVAGGGVQTTRVSAEEWPLIQPSQVSVALAPVHSAESMLTPLEQIRRKDTLVKQALAEKEGLVADMLSIPREHFQHIADMAAEGGGRDLTERVLASIFQVDQLQKAVNAALNVTELEAAAAKGGRHAACASQEEPPLAAAPAVPAHLVGDISASLSSQLTTLLSEVKQVEDERDRLRRELHRVKERLHEEHHLHSAEDDSEEGVQQEGAADDGAAE